MVKRRRIRPASALESLSPLWIVSNIAILQIAFYLVAIVFLLFTSLVQGSHFSLDLVFSWRPLRADNASGWTLALVWLCSSMINVIAITLLISRTKYVLDFSLTVYFIHLVTTSLYSQAVPVSWLWWVVQFASSLCTIILSTWLCQRRELKPIPWGGNRAARRAASSSTAVQSLEMVPLKQDQDIV